MDKSTVKWLVLAAIAVCGMLGWKVATQASKDGKKDVVVVERPEPRFGVVTAILYCDDAPTVLIEDQMLHEGDTIHEVKVLDIKADIGPVRQAGRAVGAEGAGAGQTGMVEEKRQRQRFLRLIS